MGPLDLLNHLMNFVAPALFMAVFTSLAARLLLRKAVAAPAFWKQVTLLFAAGVAVLALGLLFYGRDGKMGTYAALVVCCASVQWILLRGWRK